MQTSTCLPKCWIADAGTTSGSPRSHYTHQFTTICLLFSWNLMPCAPTLYTSWLWLGAAVSHTLQLTGNRKPTYCVTETQVRHANGGNPWQSRCWSKAVALTKIKNISRVSACSCKGVLCKHLQVRLECCKACGVILPCPAHKMQLQLSNTKSKCRWKANQAN